MKKIMIMFMLAIGIHGLTKATDADLYALVYPTSTTTSLGDLYNADPTAQDEVDKFLNNQPSKLDQYNSAASGAIGLGTRKLYLWRKTGGNWAANTVNAIGLSAVSAFVSAKAYAYIYYDTTDQCAKIHCEGHSSVASQGSSFQNDYRNTPNDINKTVLYGKILIDSQTASTNTLTSLPKAVYCNLGDLTDAEKKAMDGISYKYGPQIPYIKLTTSSTDPDDGSICYYDSATLTLGSTTISGYKTQTKNDYFIPGYQKTA